MKAYPASQIRNVAILGHIGSGKTSFSEAVLFEAGVIDRLGRINDGTTTLDFDPEEIRRTISINTSVASFDWRGTKLNLLDTPGDFDFAGEVMGAIRVAGSSLIVVSARDGLNVGGEKAVRYVRKQQIPFAFFINTLDDPHANFTETVEGIREFAGDGIVPFMLPIRKGETLGGYVDVLARQAYSFDAQGKTSPIAMPAELEDALEETYERLNETVAETSEELMEKYFSEEPFTEEEFRTGLREALISGVMHPIFCGSATENKGVAAAIDGLISCTASPDMAEPVVAQIPHSDETVELTCDPDGPLAALVFKTISDPFVGRISLFRVYSGQISASDSIYNANQEKEERVNGLSVMIGKKSQATDVVSAGDIGALAKLNVTVTGDTLCRRDKQVILPGIPLPTPSFSMAIMPVKQGDEEKIVSGLNRLRDEDPSFFVFNNPETNQIVINGLGATHIDVLRSKLGTKFKVESTIEIPRVAYRETIRKKVKVQGRHKKQSGGHGQYGDVWIEFEPGETEELTFETNVFGGSVPRNYFPAVEKGLLEAVAEGVLASYPMVNLKATLVDGSYHDVDSSEIAFKLATHLAYRAGIPQAGPVLLEPISTVRITVPDAQLGDIMSDINQKRGRIMGIDAGVDMQLVTAEVPTSEMATYATDLRQMTQGRGSYEIEFARYEQAPQQIADRVIADAKARAEQS
ncbi:MAG: elongation factor G [Bacillota bacterium]|nr:elongation factor G [Bacillota bacterium]